MDIPLTEEGRRHADELAPRLADREFTQVHMSPLSRARETCERAGLAAEANICEDLVEWDYGSYEGLTTVEIRARRPDWNLWSDGSPDGESAVDVGRRVDRVIDEVLRCRGQSALFAHGHVLRVLAARWIGLGPEAGALLALDTGTISVLGWERDTRVLWRWNETAQTG